MSRLETAAIPLLKSMMTGVAVALDSTAQGTVGLWATKTAFMLRYTEPQPRPVHPSYLGHVFLNQVPPADAQVLVASYTAALPVQYDLKSIFVSNGVPPLRREAELATISLERVVLRVATWSDPTLSHDRLTLPSFDPTVAECIWPPEGAGLWWPPRRVLDARSFHAFAAPMS